MKTNDWVIDRIIKWTIFNPYWIVFVVISLLTFASIQNAAGGPGKFGFWILGILSEIAIVVIMYIIAAFVFGKLKFMVRFYDAEEERRGKETYYQNRYNLECNDEQKFAESEVAEEINKHRIIIGKYEAKIKERQLKIEQLNKFKNDTSKR